MAVAFSPTRVGKNQVKEEDRAKETNDSASAGLYKETRRRKEDGKVDEAKESRESKEGGRGLAVY